MYDNLHNSVKRSKRVRKMQRAQLSDFAYMQDSILGASFLGEKDQFLESIIKPSEGICHHCRKSKNKKNLVYCESKDCDLSFCTLCLKRNGYKMCPVWRNEWKCNVCQNSLFEQDLDLMDFLVKASENPGLADQANSNKDQLMACDKKSIIKKNNWAICSFNSVWRYKKEPNDYKATYEDWLGINNPYTTDNEIKVEPLSKIVMEHATFGYNNYNEDSTEDLEEKASPMPIKLPVWKCSKTRKDSNKKSKEANPTTSSVKRNIRKISYGSQKNNKHRENNIVEDVKAGEPLRGPFKITKLPPNYNQDKSIMN